MFFWSHHPFTALSPPHALTSLFGKLLDSTINNTTTVFQKPNSDEIQ